MAHLTKPVEYNIQDTNIALLGSDLEKHVREEAGGVEPAWEYAGVQAGLQIWRIEKFHIVDWPTERHGSFYDGDAYIVLNTYKKDPESESLSYDLHFWLGTGCSQGEAGTAAYKTVELDDHLHGRPVQYREVENFESPRFLSYFPRVLTLKGGVATGFHHVTAPPSLDLHKLYHISLSKSAARSVLVVREVAADASSLAQGDVFLLDKGQKVLQFNEKDSAGMERFKAAEFAQFLISERKGECEVAVYDEGGPGAGLFLSELGINSVPVHKHANQPTSVSPALFKVSDVAGKTTFGSVSPVARSSLASSDAFLLDASSNSHSPCVYIWLGGRSSIAERRIATQYAQRYVYEHRGELAAISIVKITEGNENDDFWNAFEEIEEELR